jgi:hypothetical protein
MALTVTTLRPTSTSQTGLGSVVGAASASIALADNVDSTYVQLASRCRLDSQVMRVVFPTPTIPAGAKVYSVGLRRRIQTVVTGNPQPVCHHWFRSSTGIIQVAGQTADIRKDFFNSVCPASTAAVWVEESLGTFTNAPGGQAWDPATNLTGFAYDLGRGDDFASALRVSAVYLDIAYQQASGVTVTAPTGTSTSTRPTVTWTYSSADSQPQQAYRVAIYTAAQVAALGFVAFTTAPIQSSGTTSGSTAANYWVLGEDLSWTLTADITDGNYKAFVQATSRWAGSGDFPTAIASTTWVRAATPSNPPPAAVLSSATFDADNNRVALTFAPSGSSPTTLAYTVQASRNGGQSWDPIPRLTLRAANGMTPVSDFDYVAPLNVTSQYRVVSLGGSPFVAATSPSNVLSVTPRDNRHWLKHPGNPLLNTVLPVAAPKTSDTGIKITKRRMMGTFQLLGGQGSEVLPFVVSGPTYGDEHEIELFFGAGNTGLSGDDELAYLWPAVDQLDRTGGTLLFQKPDGEQLWVALGPGASGQETEETYNAVPGVATKVQWRRRKVILTETVAPDFF